MDLNKNCIIKIIVNPAAEKSFSLKFELFPKNQVYLKIMIQHVDDISQILDEIKKQIPIKYNFNIQWNWKNVPNSIKENKMIQSEIEKIFKYKEVNLKKEENVYDFNKMAEILKNHIKKHGAAPDFNKNISEKDKNKIHNYIKTVLGMPNLSPEHTTIITSIVNDV